MTLSTTINRSQTRADKLASSLREEILRGTLSEGSALRQDQIASRFDVSTIPVREALFQLTDEGLVEFVPNRGAFVSSISADELRELYIIRGRLESLALELALPNLTDDDLSKAETYLAEMEVEKDVYKWGELHWKFHSTLYTPSGAPRLLTMLRSLHVNLIRYMVTRTIEPGKLEYKYKIDMEHRELLDMCWARDKEIALVYLGRHLDDSSRVLVRMGEQV